MHSTLLYFGARVLLEKAQFATGVRVGIALVPIPFFAGFLWQVIKGVRSADEFERRILPLALKIARLFGQSVEEIFTSLSL